MSRMLAVVGLGARLGVCGATVFFMHDQGVFGDIRQGEAAYSKLKSLTLKDVVGTQICEQLPTIDIPQEVETGLSTVRSTTTDIKQNFWSYWNCGVNSVFTGLITLPDTVTTLAGQAVTQIQDSIK